MADVYEQNLGQKSSLTTSDFIRVVGSDNVSYKQGISSVMTTMGIGKVTAYGDLASFYADFSAMATDVKYFVTTWGNCSTALGLPSATYKGYATKSSATLCDMTVQTYGASGTNEEYIGRVTFNSSGAVTATNWTKQPTRAEVDALGAVSADTLTRVKTDLTFGSQNRVYRYGRMVIVTVVFTTTTNASQDTVLFTTPYSIRYPVIAIMRNDNGNTYLIGTDTENSNSIKALYGSGLPSGTYRGTFTYLAVAQ